MRGLSTHHYRGASSLERVSPHYRGAGSLERVSPHYRDAGSLESCPLIIEVLAHWRVAPSLQRCQLIGELPPHYRGAGSLEGDITCYSILKGILSLERSYRYRAGYPIIRGICSLKRVQGLLKRDPFIKKRTIIKYCPLINNYTLL